MRLTRNVRDQCSRDRHATLLQNHWGENGQNHDNLIIVSTRQKRTKKSVKRILMGNEDRNIALSSWIS